MSEKISTDRIHQLLARLSPKDTTLMIGSMLGGVFEMPAFDPREASGFAESVRFALSELLELRAHQIIEREMAKALDPFVPAANGPSPLPTDWTPTMYLRFVSRETHVADSFPAFRQRMVLQQGYVHADGNRIWVDVPTVDE